MIPIEFGVNEPEGVQSGRHKDRFGHADLAQARKDAGLYQWQVAEAMHYSEKQIQRWELGQQEPGVDAVWQLAKLYGQPKIWHLWMMSKYQGYREYNTVLEDNGFTGAVMRLRHELEDVQRLQGRLEMDAWDGKMDCEKRKAEVQKEVKELMAACRQVLVGME